MELRSVLQGGLLHLADDPRSRRIVEAPRVSRDIVSRYVAGESVETAVEVARDLRTKGRLVSVRYLAPRPATDPEAEAYARSLRGVIQRFADSGLTAGDRVDFDVELPSLGVGWGVGWGQDGWRRALERARDLARVAANAGTTVMIEPTGLNMVDHTLVAVRELRQDFPTVGVSLTAGYQRTFDDCRALSLAGSRVRLTKGAPESSPGIYRTRGDVDRAFAACLKILFTGPGRPVIATNDVRLIRITRALALHLGRGADSYEYQLRYGVRPGTQAVIADRGDRVRVHVPFGPEWYPYLMGRVASAPTNVVSLVRAVLGR